MDESLDLRDSRGRLTRLALAASIASLLTLVVIRWVQSAAVTPNSDPIAGSSVGLLAIGIFVVATIGVLAVITAVHRRLRR